MKIPAQLPWHLSSWGWVSPGIRVSRITVALSLPCCGAVYIHGLRILPVLPATLGIWHNGLTYLKWRMTSCLITVKLLHFQVLVRVPLWTLDRCFEPGGNNRFSAASFSSLIQSGRKTLKSPTLRKATSFCAYREVSKAAREAVALPHN